WGPDSVVEVGRPRGTGGKLRRVLPGEGRACQAPVEPLVPAGEPDRTPLSTQVRGAPENPQLPLPIEGAVLHPVQGESAGSRAVHPPGGAGSPREIDVLPVHEQL